MTFATQHFNEDKIPFYAWECITIQFKNRDLDLVIKKEKNMNYLLKFLIHNDLMFK